jgi:ribonucleoside-diphosphate reductase alpha chain
VQEASGPPPPVPAPHSPKAEAAASPGSATSAVAEAPRSEPAPATEGRQELAVIASNGAANGHATNGKPHGNGAGNGGGGITLNLGGTKVAFAAQADAPSCAECGSIMVRNGSCYKCLNCGSTSGCS